MILFQFCRQLKECHLQLINMASQLAPGSIELVVFGELLRKHTRQEDREIFPNVRSFSHEIRK